jgi:thiamine biosynthesis lipoprotein
MRTGDGAKRNKVQATSSPTYPAQYLYDNMRSVSPILLLIFLLLFVQCGNQDKSAGLFVIDGSTMGTVYSVKLVESELNQLAINRRNIQPGIDRLLTRINQKMSTYIETSEISRFNEYEKSDWFPVSDELRIVIEKSLLMSKISDGAFDITVGPLVNLWGFGSEEREVLVPEDSEIEERINKIGYKKISTKRHPSALKKELPEIYCDLSGIAKGYGVDKIGQHLDSLKITNYLIDIGGELKSKGNNHLAEAWRIGISSPDEKFGIQKIVSLTSNAMATSGDYRNYFKKDGQIFSHTIDPLTGRPITHQLASVTVVHDSCIVADALATAITVMGPEKGHEFALKMELPVFMIVREQSGFVEKRTPMFDVFLSSEKDSD